jgi:pilus assembly protein Flp/PilA
MIISTLKAAAGNPWLRLWANALAARARQALPAKEIREAGQGLPEYALMIVLVAVVVIVVLSILGPTLNEMYLDIIDCIDPSVSGGTCAPADPEPG